MKKINELLNEHPFFDGLAQEYLDFIAGCGRNVRFNVDEILFNEGDPANEFYIIRYGQVAVEMQAPGRGTMNIYTLHENDILGWSWLVAPYRWRTSGRAVQLTRAIAMDGRCLRGKCDEDPKLGYELMKRFAVISGERLQTMYLQVLNVYG